MLKLYNTLTRKIDVFKPIKKDYVGVYTCGPTVYLYAHIGNLRTYIFEDILKRILLYNKYKIKHVMNITDVGHLTSDADIGEDKMEIGARREKKTAWEIAEFYTNSFKRDLNLLNIKEPDIWIKATDTIKDQINLIKILERKGFTYKIKDGIYFDSPRLKTYGRLLGKKDRKIKARARVEMVEGKRNSTDFALWKFTPSGVKRQMEWDSLWGKGFPGWHTECVVMSIKYLGIPFDIHCGGIDHISIHHTNEIAQAEAAFGKILANYWMHGEFLIINKEKMAKSTGEFLTLNKIIEKNYSPLNYRYLCLTANYRQQLSFSWDALDSARNSLNSLKEKILELESKLTSKGKEKIKLYEKKFLEEINNDLNIPKALAVLWEVIKDKNLGSKEKLNLIFSFDKVFGLDLKRIKKIKIPDEIKKLRNEREKARKEKNWKEADKIRNEILDKGYIIEDSEAGPKIKKKDF